MSDTPTAPTRLAVLALDLDGGDPVAIDAFLARLTQVTRHGTEPGGVVVGNVRHVLVSDLTADDFFAAIASLKVRHE